MPRAEVVAIITAPSRAGVGAKVMEIRRGLGGFEIVIAQRRPRSLFVAPPARPVTFAELLGGSFGISVVPGGENRAGDLIQEFGRRFGLIHVATRNIASAHPHWRRCLR